MGIVNYLIYFDYGGKIRQKRVIHMQSNKTRKRKSKHSDRKKLLEYKREKQRQNYTSLVARDGEQPEFAPFRAVLFDNKSIGQVAMKYSIPRATLQDRLDKLVHSDESPFNNRRKGSGKLSTEMKDELRKILMLQPFKLPPTITVQEDESEHWEYYARYTWTNGLLRQYIQKQWGIPLTNRYCTDLLKELQPNQMSLFDTLKSEGLKNVWILFNVKLCEKQVMTTKRIKGEKKTIEDIVNFYACIAYSFGTAVMYQVYPNKVNYSKFIESVCKDDMSSNAIIIFVEDKSNKNTKDKNALAFCEYQDKIKLIFRSEVSRNKLYEKCKAIQTVGAGADESFNADNEAIWLKYILLYNMELSDEKIAEISDDSYGDDEDELDNAFMSFCNDFLIMIREVMLAIDKSEISLPIEDVQAMIEDLLDDLINGLLDDIEF